MFRQETAAPHEWYPRSFSYTAHGGVPQFPQGGNIRPSLTAPRRHQESQREHHNRSQGQVRRGPAARRAGRRSRGRVDRREGRRAVLRRDRSVRRVDGYLNDVVRVRNRGAGLRRRRRRRAVGREGRSRARIRRAGRGGLTRRLGRRAGRRGERAVAVRLDLLHYVILQDARRPFVEPPVLEGHILHTQFSIT